MRRPSRFEEFEGFQEAATSFSRQWLEPDETSPNVIGETATSLNVLPQETLQEYRISRLEARLMRLERGLPAMLAAAVAENQPVSTNLLSLGIPGYRVLRAIPVTIRQDGGEFIASFFDANISTGGETHQEAIENLQTLIADFYDELDATPQEELGPSIQRQKCVLAEFVCRT